MFEMPEPAVLVLPLRGAGPTLPIVEPGSSARAVIWPGCGASARSVHLVRLAPSSRTVRLEHLTEGVYYVLAGSGTVVGDGPAEESGLVEGSMVHVDAGTGYRFIAGTDGLEFFGGPCPPDPALYESRDGRGEHHDDRPGRQED